uniref:Helicase ATP-binding domain-containing protein n=1 Tax=Apteryx owenii TaxID=8824 RepID=A0A8B9Q9K8_APTOW
MLGADGSRWAALTDEERLAGAAALALSQLYAEQGDGDGRGGAWALPHYDPYSKASVASGARPALPMLLRHDPQNLIAQSQSGTGKTAAFVLAMLSRVTAAERHPQCLCLAPTFELAMQIGRVVEKMGQFCPNIRVIYAVQGNRVAPGTVLQEQIVIGTPGTVLDWCFKRRVLDLKKISVFVLDEADVMIDKQGFSSQSIRIRRCRHGSDAKETAENSFSFGTRAGQRRPAGFSPLSRG